MKKIIVALSALLLCLLVAGCGRDGKDGKAGTNGKDGINGKDGSNGKDGVPGKDGLSFRVVTQFEVAKCGPSETLASAICIPFENAGTPPGGGGPGFQTPNNAGEPNVMMATCPKLYVRVICTK